jgi:GAF domain-containing protein
VLSIQSYKLDAYTEEHLNLLVGVSAQAAIAIENARLFEETVQIAKRLTILNEVASAVSALKSLPDLLEVVYERAKWCFSMDVFYVGLYDPAANAISFPIVYDKRPLAKVSFG